ncbi:hypothetical protein [Synechocystis sp. LKSZ1]|uniref:hypothetical protein n=1 Tax=Synechocystis sp. LKSZ1 TaxID=3144951 RepID=UPI00336BDD79
MTTIWIDAHLSLAIAIWITNTFGITALALRDLGLRGAFVCRNIFRKCVFGAIAENFPYNQLSRIISSFFVIPRLPLGPFLYCIWAIVSILIALVFAGLSPDSLTRILVLLFLFAQLLARSLLPRVLPLISPRTRFIVIGIALAVVVEGCHMFSKPVFSSLRVSPDTPLALGLYRYGLDLLFTLPAYLVIFLVIWLFIKRLYFPLWHYVLVVGFAQVLGDGGLFYFVSSPAMFFFLPYPMSNYHAMNILPYLAVCDQLPSDLTPSFRIYLVVPAVFMTYFVCGTLIRLLGQQFGLA